MLFNDCENKKRGARRQACPLFPICVIKHNWNKGSQSLNRIQMGDLKVKKGMKSNHTKHTL